MSSPPRGGSNDGAGDGPGGANGRDACALAQAVGAGELLAEELAREALEGIDALDGELGAFLFVDREGALERARAVDRARSTGATLGPLAGVPVAIKANLCLEGSPTSCASRVLEGWRAPYTATAVQRLLDAGAVVVGLTNMDEFAMGSSTENSCRGPTRNPWDPSRIPGGSSGGSAAAVAAGMVPLALGSDTGGSVRQPAALCGVSGFKPTYGRVSRYGLVAFGSSLDQVSPLARSVRDLELAAGIMSGADPADSTCAERPPLDPHPPAQRLEGLRVGVAPELLPRGVDDDVRAAVEAAVEVFAAAGAEVREVSLPHLAHALPTYYVVAAAEASSNLARYDGVRYGARREGDGSLQGMLAATRAAGFGTEVKRRILLGTFVLSAGYAEAWYGRAQRVRTRLARDFEQAFAEVEVVLGPTAPGPAFPLGERADDPLAMYAADTLTVPASLAGLPAASVPCGLVERDGARLPVGLQIVGPAWRDVDVLAAARAFQGATDHVARPPAFVGGAA